jgi:hypothetical protein
MGAGPSAVGGGHDSDVDGIESVEQRTLHRGQQG